MDIVANVLVGIVALLHVFFLILEMFLWQTSFGKKVFGLTTETAKLTAVLAMNQGFYNGILAAGLIWSFFIQDPHLQLLVRTYLLLSIIAAGIFGAFTAKRTILYTQALPALVALIAVWM